MKNRAFIAMEALIVGLIIVLVGVFIVIVGVMLLGTIGYPTGAFKNYSNGSRVGVVTKLSNKGFIWKSWEGEMNIGGFRNSTDSNGNSNIVANIFAFNIESPEVVKKIQEAMQTGDRVELVYRQWGLKPITISSRYVITEVRPTK
jgi:hypothetical protein